MKISKFKNELQRILGNMYKDNNYGIIVSFNKMQAPDSYILFQFTKINYEIRFDIYELYDTYKKYRHCTSIEENKAYDALNLIIYDITEKINASSQYLLSSKFDDYNNFESIKDSIYFRLYQNGTFKKSERIYMKYNDELSYVFYIRYYLEEDMVYDFPVQPSLFISYRQPIEQWFRYAIENTMRLFKHKISNLIVSESFPISLVKKDTSSNSTVDYKKLVYLTNEHEFYGASVIAYPNLLREIANAIGHSFYVYFLTQHNILIVPIIDYSFTMLTLSYVKNEMKELVTNPVPDNLYLYDYHTNSLQKTEHIVKK